MIQQGQPLDRPSMLFEALGEQCEDERSVRAADRQRELFARDECLER